MTPATTTTGAKTIGYDKPLYILPFDHRHSYGEEIFGYHEPMGPEQIAVVAASKQVIYDSYKHALAAGAPQDRTGILVDEEFGADILRDALESGYTFCMPTEKSGQHEFDFDYGADFAQHIDEFDPTFTKVLVRHNPDGDAVLNQRQTARLKQLSDYLQAHKRLFMFELLVPAEEAQLKQVKGDKHAYDIELRPGLMIRAMHQLQDAGVEPDVWKIEGLDQRADCEKLVAAARRGHRQHVGCIVLGRGEDEARVVTWLKTAATVPGFIGFAVGRSTFLKPIVDLRAKRISRETAIEQVSAKFREWIDVFEGARAGAKK
jgi:myo-inositol catabolism protein IolC